MDDSDTLLFACSVIKNYSKSLNNKEARLRKGLEMRMAIKSALERGEDIKNYRTEWILETVDAILDTLMIKGQEFNEKHHDDLISAGDFMDVLATALNEFKKVTNKV